jgi:hypothetical protein
MGDDLHALIIQKALEKYNDLKCHIVQSDRICGSGVLSWSNVKEGNFECRLPVRDGSVALDVSGLDVIWWRRVGFPQQIPSTITDPAHVDVIENDCRASLSGLLLNEFRGTWINHPINTALAENKLVQLRVAQHAGFRVPRTLVSQDPTAIRHFCEWLDYKVVVKPVRGTRKTRMFTNMITPAHLTCDDSTALCPAIYQEYVSGDRHVRVQCFGDAVYSVMIKSQDLDWRANIGVPLTPMELAEDVKTLLRNVLKLLGLKMGVVDLKLTPEGEPVWFEINPQGQFLFVEGLSGLDLTSAFTDFLYQEARKAAKHI